MERCITDPDTGLLFLAVEVTDEAIKEKLNLVITDNLESTHTHTIYIEYQCKPQFSFVFSIWENCMIPRKTCLVMKMREIFALIWLTPYYGAWELEHEKNSIK